MLAKVGRGLDDDGEGPERGMMRPLFIDKCRSWLELLWDVWDESRLEVGSRWEGRRSPGYIGGSV